MNEPTQKSTAQNNFAAWLSDPRLAEYMGRTFAVRLDALTHALTGQGRAKELAERNGISIQKFRRHVARARRVFLTGEPLG